MRAMFCAMTLFLANVGNLLITPPLIGALNDWFARCQLLTGGRAAAGDAVHRADRPVGDDPLLHRRPRHPQTDQVRARAFPF